MTEELTLEDLVLRSNMNRRTLRYYMQEGILQGPHTRGKNAQYSQMHLDRLELIRRLKEMYLPLQEIKHLIETLTPEEISQVRQCQDALNPNLARRKSSEAAYDAIRLPQSSALEYIHSLQQAQSGVRASPPGSRPQAVVQPAAPAGTIAASVGEGERWIRVKLANGIELNICETTDVDTRKKIKDLIKYARTLFGKKS